VAQAELFGQLADRDACQIDELVRFVNDARSKDLCPAKARIVQVGFGNCATSSETITLVDVVVFGSPKESLLHGERG